MLAIIKKHLLKSAEVKVRTINDCHSDIAKATTIITTAFKNGHKLLLCGNGGSAADCQHLAAEFVSRLSQDFERPALPAIALTTDSSFLTAFTNDCGYELVFARQIEALGKVGDVLLAISTSGTSSNVLQAMAEAKKMNMRVILLSGMNSLKIEYETLIKPDVIIAVPSDNTQYIQETHLAIEHIICHLVERQLFSTTSL